MLFVLIHFVASAIATKVLIEGWTFSETGTDKWYQAYVPSTVHLDLMDNGLIEDPYINDNIDKMKELENKEWTYQTSFDAQKVFDQTRLIFEGLDTHVDIFLNGKKILDTDNQHRVWILNLVNFLETDNILTLNFHSASVHDVKAAQAENVPIPYSYAYSRKAAYHYGWDWGPRIVTCGIWKPVYLEQTNFGAIRNIHFRTLSIIKPTAKVQISLKAQFFRYLVYSVHVTINNQTQNLTYINTNLYHRQNLYFNFTIDNPQFWWPIGQGKQNMYDVFVELKVKDYIIDQKLIRSGIRIAKWSDNMHLSLNGREIYVKGANYIPPDMFMPRMLRNPERYLKIFQVAINGGYNALRLWGGGQFEYDIFYELADKYGILIWHDMMFSAAMYPSLVFDTAIQEIKNNVIRLRNHPSIVLWNGNNEGKQGQLEWGFNAGTPEQAKIKENWYDQLFNKFIPALLQVLDPDTFYLASSPSVMVNSDQFNGVIHYWGVWSLGHEIEMFKEKIGYFNAEYGMQAIPEMSSIKKFITNHQDWSMDSLIFQKHQKHIRGMLLLNVYINAYTKPTQNFFYKIYNSQVVQYFALQMGIESLRAAKPYNKGSFYWQMNDVWPATSWSTIDYYGCYKAGHYAAKQAHAPVLLLVKLNQTLQVFANSDLPNTVNILVKIKLMSFNGFVELEFSEIQVILRGGSNELIFEFGNISVFNENHLHHYLSLNLRYDNYSINSSYMFARPKDLLLLDPQISMQIDDQFITLQAKNYAKYVYLYSDDDCLILEDNYFDIHPGTPMVLKNANNYTDVKFLSIFDIQ